MKTMSSAALLEQLQADTRQIILQVHYLLQQDPEILVQAPAPGKWSVAQVIEHLNSYGRYYLPVMEKAITDTRYATNKDFKPGWLGNYFTKTMLPNKDGVITNTMKTPNDHRPSPDVDSQTVLQEFQQQEKWLLALLEIAGRTDLGRVRVPISIAKFIKLKLGDTFRFFVAHHQRHFVQVKNTLGALQGN